MISAARHESLAQGYEAFNRGELERAVAHLHPDVEWIEPAEFVGGGLYRGHRGVIEYLDRARRHWEFVESVPELMVDVGDDKVVVVVRTRARPHDQGPSFESRIADVYTFDGGSVVHMRAFADPDEAFASVGAEPSR